jgi:uroporphyrinogen decarboxylase
MNKIERIDRVLSRQSVDRPPVSLWYHFGLQHGGADQFAQATLSFFDYYDFDFLKVMNDYFYPPPEGLDAIDSAAGLKRLTRFSGENSAWREQFKAIEIIAAALKGKAYFMDTVFDAWQSIHRNLAAENMKALMDKEPQALLDALDRVTDNLIAYSQKVIASGAAGIFLSIPAGSEILSREQFLTFVLPFARRLLESVSPIGKLTTLHVHGQSLFFDDILDLPAPVFNWWDRGPEGPSLQWVKERIPGCVMGGIDQTIVARRTRAFLKQHTREGIQSGGRERFLLANGCTIDSWVYPGAVSAIVQTAKLGFVEE